MRHYRWKSRHYFAKHIKSSTELSSLLDLQDILLVRSLCHHIVALVYKRSEKKLLLEVAESICFLINSILLENGPILKAMLKACLIEPEAFPFLVEYCPALQFAIDILPELLPSLYHADLMAWIVLRYPIHRLEPLLTAFFTGTSVKVITIALRICVALPPLIPHFLPLISRTILIYIKGFSF